MAISKILRFDLAFSSNIWIWCYILFLALDLTFICTEDKGCLHSLNVVSIRVHSALTSFFHKWVLLPVRDHLNM